MSDFLQHECGIAAVRLRKPLSYYAEKYGNCLWGFQKLFLLMEKQHNRGHDGVGIGCCKLGMAAGEPYIFRRRDARKDSLSELFRREMKRANKRHRQGMLDLDDAASVKAGFDFGGELLLGHLRYGTSGKFDEGSCHPYLRRSNWPARTLMVMGNFNMANAGLLSQQLIERGQHPVFGTDTQTVMEEVGYHLDHAHYRHYHDIRQAEPGLRGAAISERISERIDVPAIIRAASESWDGGYAIAGVVGHGSLFVLRDPHGIRPCYVYVDEEVVAIASERVPLMTVFETGAEQVRPLEPGYVWVISADGEVEKECFAEPKAVQQCSFERIYFSRGNDPEIYEQRKALGQALAPRVVEAVGGDMHNSVFSFIPNTAEIAYGGLMDGLRLHCRQQVRDRIVEAQRQGRLSEELLDELILDGWPRGEKIAHKDIKLRTFISQESARNQLVSHVYDITYGVVKPSDTLVVLDDSIVRGTTLKESILKMLARTKPKKIVICSTAPQIRYPDCYGIDMSELGKFIAFQAAISLLKGRGRHGVLDEVARACQAELERAAGEQNNAVQAIYAGFSEEEISAEISRLVGYRGEDWDGEVEIIFQSIESLHNSLGSDFGDWYFTGVYPTPAGNEIVNRAYLHWYHGKSGRSYEGG